MIEKVTLRMHLRSLRKSQFPKSIQSKSSIIANRLYDQDFYKQAENIGLYAAQDVEVQTKGILKEIQTTAKRAWLPKVVGGALHFGLVQDPYDLQEGFKEILEPKQVQSLAPIDLLLIPCVGVDLWGRRLGQGGGYYDRFLETYKKVKVALAFDFQVHTLMPSQEHDIDVDYIITDQRVIRCF